ncbi:MAG TPA: hypothetical protein DCG28_03020 [Lachnospiraceae bacterium]|nr:hypothetical protein [Lachnospiraceae bacterium]
MKKKIFALTTALLITATPVFADSDISVEVNGKNVDFAEYDNVKPYIENDYTLVPIRAIAENLGLNVGWDEDKKAVSLSNEGTDISIEIDSYNAIVNGESVSLDIPARITDSRTFVPLRFVSESTGANVKWDSETKLISINTNEEKTEGTFDRQGGGQRGQGGAMTQNSPEIQAVIDENSSKFTQLSYNDEKTGITLEYSLYVPENYDENTSYPFIMYIPDSSASGKSAKEIVEQYYGANVWVTDEDQAKHASFVLVPAFSETVVDDNFNVSEQVEAAVNLINDLTAKYNIDKNRLYTTGQSMGCMTSLYLNSKYPDMFAASMFVSGQWDISVLKGLEDKKFFYITAGGDAKASGGQDEVKAMFDEDGVKYTYNEWNAQLSDEEQTALVNSLLEEGLNANMIRFETGTVLTEGSGMEHMASFNYGYKLTAVRDWLFDQK